MARRDFASYRQTRHASCVKNVAQHRCCVNARQQVSSFAQNIKRAIIGAINSCCMCFITRALPLGGEKNAQNVARKTRVKQNIVIIEKCLRKIRIAYCCARLVARNAASKRANAHSTRKHIKRRQSRVRSMRIKSLQNFYRAATKCFKNRASNDGDKPRRTKRNVGASTCNNNETRVNVARNGDQAS